MNSLLSNDKEVYISDIEFVGYEDLQCITIEDPKGLYIMDDGVITHNSLALLLSYLYVSTHFGLMRSPWAYFGQAQPLDSKILMYNNEYATFKNIKTGDKIMSPTKKYSYITEIKDWQDLDCYELEFYNSSKTKCSDQHLWTIKNKVGNTITVDFRTIRSNIDDYFFNVGKLKKVTYIGKQLQRCITVSNKDGLYITDDNIITHNSPATIYTSVMCGATIKKASELLVEPFRNILEQATYFEKVRTQSDMKKRDEEFRQSGEFSSLPWCTAGATSEVSFAGGNNYKLISSASGLLGQAQPLDEPILLVDQSYTAMGKLKIGDIIASPTEISQTVVDIFPQGNIDCYEIMLDDGRNTYCSLKHLWKVSYKKDDKNSYIWEIVTTEFILNNINEYIVYDIAQYTKILTICYIGKKEQQCILVSSKDHLYQTRNKICTHNTILIGGITEIGFFKEFAGWALEENTLIKMNDLSDKKLKDIAIGDSLYHPYNKENIVKSIPFNDIDDVYEIQLSSGKKAYCNINHLWPVSFKINNELISCIVTTKFMIDNNDIDFEIDEVLF